MFLHLSVSHSVHGGGACVFEGGCVVAGGHKWLPGVCVVVEGHAWLQEGMCGCGGHVWLQGVCMVVGEGHVWLQGACMVVGGMCGCGGGVVAGGVHGCGGACIGYDEIRSMSGRYASYWNVFLFIYAFKYLLIRHHCKTQSELSDLLEKDRLYSTSCGLYK